MSYFKYIIISAVCLSIFYSVYKLIYKNDKRFKHIRFFLLTSVFLSLLLPFSTFRITLENLPVMHDVQNQSVDFHKIQSLSNKSTDLSVITDKTTTNQDNTDLSGLFKKIYFIISLSLFASVLIQMVVMYTQYFNSQKQKHGRFIIVFNKRIRNASSFFNIIFISSDLKDDDELDQIILHEKIHARQYHSIDIIIVELLAIIMWFNPVVWMIRKSIQQVHEYLADEGVLNTGIDRLRYQSILLNQVTETKINILTSSFNSLIKKRMIMISKNRTKSDSRLKVWTILPITGILLILEAIINGLSPMQVSAGIKIGNITSVPETYNFIKSNESIRIQDTIKLMHQKKNKKRLNDKDADNSSHTNIEKDSNEFAKDTFGTSILFFTHGTKIDTIPVTGFLSTNFNTFQDLNNSSTIKPTHNFTVTKRGNSKTIIIIDGIEKPGFWLGTINPSNIESFGEETNKALLNAYMRRGFDKVIYITTKK